VDTIIQYFTNPDTMPWTILAVIVMSVLVFATRRGFKNLTNSSIPIGSKRKVVGLMGLLTMISAASCVGCGIGGCNQATTSTAPELAGAMIAGGLAGVIVGIIIFCVSVNWDFKD